MLLFNFPADGTFSEERLGGNEAGSKGWPFGLLGGGSRCVLAVPKPNLGWGRWGGVPNAVLLPPCPHVPLYATGPGGLVRDFRASWC